MSKIKFKKATEADLNNDAKITRERMFSGVIPSPEDDRDFTVAAAAQSFPQEYESPATEILDQGPYGMCVAHAIVSAMMRFEKLMCGQYSDYSRGYIYANRRDTDYQGEGMIMRQGLKQTNHCGTPWYPDFPYRGTYPDLKKRISEEEKLLARLAEDHKIRDYFRCYSESDIKETVMTHGSVVITVPVYDNFGRDLHEPEAGAVETGSHAMIIIGWTKDNKWIVQNSWGELWGYGGKLRMDFSYPIYEMWGLSMEVDNVVPREKSWFEKLWRAVIGGISTVKQYILCWINRFKK